MTPLERLRQRRSELLAQITADRARGTELLGLATLNDEQRAEIQTLTERGTANRGLVDQLDNQIREEEAAEARSATARQAQTTTGTTPEARGVGGARVTREERTYTAQKSRTGQASFFSDAYRAQVVGDPQAQQRIGRHLQEVAVEGEHEGRATTTSSFAGLVVPQYLVDESAMLLRVGRPVANAVNRMPLPAQGMSLIIPRGTTGASVTSQATENSSLSSTDEVWANLTVPVCTLGGQQDVSRQSLERGTPGIDSIIYLDLRKAYNVQVDTQVLNGSGSSGQMLGILNTSGIYASSVYGAALTTAAFYTKSAGALSAIASAGTAVIPNVWVMHPRRWYWLSAQLDSQGRPLVVPSTGGNAAMNGMAINANPGGYSGDNDASPPQIMGYYQGLPVIIDANVPTNKGVATSEDPVIAMDSSQAYLWEDNGGVPRELRFEQTLGNQLTVKLVLYNYAAFTAGRYPVAFGQVGGNESAGAGAYGQIAPTF